MATARRTRSASSSVVVPVKSSARSVGVARRRLETALAEWSVPPAARYDALLVASEMVTNAVRYAKAPIELRARLDGPYLVVEVLDGAPEVPQRSEPDLLALGGRGLHIISALSESWGVRPHAAGKSVWCTLRV